MEQDKEVMIVGGGLVGSILAIQLAKKGYKVNLFEKFQDPRIIRAPRGRAINLGINSRGLIALDDVGLKQQVLKYCIPMYGRLFHNADGTQTFIPFGKHGETSYSVKRQDLHLALMNQVFKHPNINVVFNHRCVDVDLQNTTVKFVDPTSGTQTTSKSNVILGSDGHFSQVRLAIQTKADILNYTQVYVEHGYKEITISANQKGEHRYYPYALHFWSRKNFTITASPNPDGTFTCTFFFQAKGQQSFSSIKDEASVINLFKKYLPDLLPICPNLVDEFLTHPLCNLGTINCSPWNYQDKVCLIGDSAHAMLPFTAQGLNCNFQDAYIFNKIIDKHPGNWKKIFEEFNKVRKPNSDAAALLSFNNYDEIRYKQNDQKFNLLKRIEGRVIAENQFYIHAYSMASFHAEYTFKQVWDESQRRKFYLEKLAEIENVFEKWESPEVKSLVKELVGNQIMNKIQLPTAKL